MVKYSLNSDFLTADLEGSTIVFNAKNHSLHTLNHTARFVIQHLLKNTSTAVIAEKYSKSFGVSKATASDDVSDTIKELKKRGIIHVNAD